MTAGPSDSSVLDTADTILFISDGMQWSPWSLSPERIATMQKQIDRGCGFMLFHFATYIPYKFQKQALGWDGGYVKYDGPKYPHMYFRPEDAYVERALSRPSIILS